MRGRLDWRPLRFVVEYVRAGNLTPADNYKCVECLYLVIACVSSRKVYGGPLVILRGAVLAFID